MFYAGLFIVTGIESSHKTRAWYNGSTSASQAEDEGSIPFARTKKLNRPCVGFVFWIVGDGIEPDKAASAAQGSERSGAECPTQ